jgi:transcription antitermination factor NusG
LTEKGFVIGWPSRPQESPEMPILPREPDIFPEDVLAEAHWAQRPPEAKWWALYTLPRREKDLVRRLRNMTISHYSPMIARRTRSPGGRVRTSYVPLFSGYVFVLGCDEERHRAVTTNCVSRCLEVPNGERLAHDLRQVRRLIDSGAPLTPEARIEPGHRVRIRAGSLIGLEGTVVKRRGTARLLVVVEFLQRGASVQLDDYQVERID